MTVYAVVQPPGTYGSGERVTADSVHVRLGAAIRRCLQINFGSKIGGYRIVETTDPDPVWQFGHELDRVPSVRLWRVAWPPRVGEKNMRSLAVAASSLERAREVAWEADRMHSPRDITELGALGGLHHKGWFPGKAAPDWLPGDLGDVGDSNIRDPREWRARRQ